MTIETINKKYTDDFNLFYRDFKSTHNQAISKTDFIKMFDFEQCIDDLKKVYEDNLFSYSDVFILSMNIYFNDYNLYNVKSMLNSIMDDLKKVQRIMFDD